MTTLIAEDYEPMSCDAVSRVEDLKGGAEAYLMNPKLDGFRLLAFVQEDGVRFLTRGLKWQDGKLPYTEAAIKARFAPGTILDGEIMALRSATANEIADGKPGLINDFEHVQSIMLSKPERAVAVAAASRPLTYHCFDIVQTLGIDVSDWPLENRVAMLEELDLDQDEFFQLTPYVEATQEHHDGWVAAGFEGSVCKHKDSPYTWGSRGKGWFKIKATWTMDAVVVGFVPGQGKNKGKVGSIVFAQRTADPDYRRQSAKFADDLYKASMTAKLKGDVTDLANISERLIELNGLAIRGCARGFDDAIMDDMTQHPGDWFGQVVEITHNGEMAGGLKVRHPQFLRRRVDKDMVDADWRTR